MRKAADITRSGGSRDAAKVLCPRSLFIKGLKSFDSFRAYYNPVSRGLRYSSFGRHFTLPEKLTEIVERIHPYIDSGDMVVDFCCGANKFSVLLNAKLSSVGKTCQFKNFDIITPKDTFCFTELDWFTTSKENGFLEGNKLVIGLNPPFGVHAALATRFVRHALSFKPKLLILIVPPETMRFSKDFQKENYELIWEDKELLKGKAFYLPGSIDKVNKENVKQWNMVPPPLFLWSRSDMVQKHRDTAVSCKHIQGPSMLDSLHLPLANSSVARIRTAIGSTEMCLARGESGADQSHVAGAWGRGSLPNPMQHRHNGNNLLQPSLDGSDNFDHSHHSQGLMEEKLWVKQPLHMAHALSSSQALPQEVHAKQAFSSSWEPSSSGFGSVQPFGRESSKWRSTSGSCSQTKGQHLPGLDPRVLQGPGFLPSDAYSPNFCPTDSHRLEFRPPHFDPPGFVRRDSHLPGSHPQGFCPNSHPSSFPSLNSHLPGFLPMDSNPMGPRPCSAQVTQPRSSYVPALPHFGVSNRLGVDQPGLHPSGPRPQHPCHSVAGPSDNYRQGLHFRDGPGLGVPPCPPSGLPSGPPGSYSGPTGLSYPPPGAPAGQWFPGSLDPGRLQGSHFPDSGTGGWLE